VVAEVIQDATRAQILTPIPVIEPDDIDPDDFTPPFDLSALAQQG
jgi:hypothetical protein